MENKFTVNVVVGGAKDSWSWRREKPKPHKGEYTWDQLMYWIHECVNADWIQWDINRRNHKGYGVRWSRRHRYRYECEFKEKEPTRNEHHEVEIFFSTFRNNPNDGRWTCGSWKHHTHREFIQQKDENGRLTSEWLCEVVDDGKEWVPKTFKPHPYQVVDSYGRIIPSGYLKAAFLRYIPNPEHKKPVYYSGYYYRNWYSSYDHDRDFRKGPVPGRGGYRNRCGHRYAGNHCGGKPWKRDFCAAKVDQREIREEYGITFSMPDKMPYKHGYAKSKSWKRTRIEKQWMKKVIRNEKVCYW